MDDGSPELGVGFLIDPGGSFSELQRLQAVMGSTEAKVLQDAAQIERATSGMIKGTATAQVTTFGSAATREMRNVARETAAAERSGEAMVRQLTRQAETFGKTASQIRNMRAEQRALVAESSGLTELAGRIRMLNTEMNRMEAGNGRVGASSKLAGHHVQNLVFQVQDLSMGMVAAAGSSAPLKMALMTLFQQGTQIQGIAMQAGVSVRSLGGEIGGMASRAALAHPVLLGFTAAAGGLAAAIGMIGDSAKDDAAMLAYVQSLGLTAKEIRHLDDVTVTWGDKAKAVFQVAGRAIWDYVGPAVTSVWSTMKEWLAWIGSGVKGAANFLIGGFVGAFNVISKTWSSFPSVIGDIFYSAVNMGISAINALIRKSVDGLNSFISGANALLGKVGIELPQLTAPQINAVANQYAGAIGKIGKVAQTEMNKAFGVDYIGKIGDAFQRNVLDPIHKQAEQNARDRLLEQATKKGYLDPEKGKKGNDRAARLAREAEAVEAQIRNLYALAEAYEISGAAALIAEARVKAESEAIKKQGDIEAMVDRQIRLSIAQRISDGAKANAGLRDQAEAQEAVNAMVAAGIIPASAAGDLVKDQLADLPLLAAAQAAQQRGLAEEAALATLALDNQRKARLRLRDAEEAAKFNADMSAGANRLAELREELRLVGATNAERVHTLAVLKATQEAEAKFTDPARRAAYIKDQVDIADTTERLGAAQRDYNASLTHAAEMWDLIARNVQNAAQGMSDAFGSAGQALGGLASIYADFQSERARADAEHIQRLRDAGSAEAKAQEQARHALSTSTMQLGLYGDMASAAKGFFKEKSAGYKAMMAAEKIFRAFEFAMSLKAMVQDVAETASSVANSAARATAAGTEGIAEQSKLPFPFNIAAMAATGAALIAAGVAVIGALGGKSKPLESNKGTGTVLGDPSAQSESIKNAINALKEVDTVMLTYSRQMAGSLKAIESNISGFASLLVRNGDSLNASSGISEGFKTNAIGSILSKIPLVGGILGSLFGTKTTVLASGLYGSAQSLGSILSGGFDGQTYSDIQKKKKLFGITTSNKTSTQYGSLDPTIENQFTLILREFNNAIIAAAGPLGAATNDIQQKLNGFVVNIGKIDLKGLTGTEIEEKLNAVFGAAADRMAVAAFPMIQQFQKAGEGAFETLVRVASTLESVTSTLDLLGQSAQGMSIAAKLGLADQFDSVSDLTSAVDSYFQSFYTKEEQAAARTAQMGKVFESLGLAMPTTLAGFRQLVEAQNLNTAAGQEVYATLLKLAPAFADLQAAMDGAKSAADIASERADLQRQLLELQGDTAALRALQLAKLDASNRALQEEIWSLQDAQAAAKAAQDLADAWKSAGDSIMDEVRRIRGLTDAGGGNSFAALMSQFNAATSAARGGDIDAAKSLPQLSQALLAAAQDAATSRQELDRIRAQTAASLEATNGLIGSLSGTSAASTNAALLGAAAASQSGTTSANDNGDSALAAKLDELRDEVARLRTESNSGFAAVAANTGKTAKKLDDITSDSGGNAVSVEIAA